LHGRGVDADGIVRPGPTSPLQVAVASPLILEAASTAVDDIIAASKTAHRRASIESLGIASPNSVLVAAYLLAVALAWHR
jgi:hypothetical protein